MFQCFRLYVNILEVFMTHKMVWKLKLAVLILMAVFYCGPKSAATMIPLSTENLTSESTLIIVGKVQHLKSEWSEDKKSIYTVATVTVEKTIKGKGADKKLKIIYEGGEIDGIGMRVSDIAIPDVGYRMLLFLKPAKSRKLERLYTNVGKAQGQYKIGSDGIARKAGYLVEGTPKNIDNNIPLEVLIEKIKNVRDE